jgi:dihydroorotase
VLSAAPARITGLSQHGTLEAGTGANLVLVDPAAPHVLDPDVHRTMGRNNPFRGTELGMRVTDTFLYGARVVADGELGEPLDFAGAGPWND